MPIAINSENSPCPDAVNVGTAECQYGAVLVAANAKGICDIQLGANRDRLVEDYRRTATSKVLWADGNKQSAWLTSVLNLAEDPTYVLDHPLDIQGTPFQTAVWQALGNVPAGQTTTYGDLAYAIGKPTATRAVGAACGTNRLALAIPCHRALRKGKGPLEYRWGKEIKQKILAAEAAWVFAPR